MSKHTPGPWHTGIDDSDKVFAADRDGIAVMSGGRRYQAERDANARLIAAAPELLEACRVVRNALDAGEHPGRLASVLDAAITRAVGAHG